MKVLKWFIKKFFLNVYTAFRRKLKQKRTRSFYRKFIKPGDLCFDIGANVGNRSNVFLSIGARVIAVEPQKACIDVMKKRFKNNSKIFYVQKAVGSKEESREMMICNENQLSTFSKEFINIYRINSSFDWNNLETANLTTLDTLIKEYGVPQFCKIDVEAFEEEVFNGLSYPIKFISFEFNAPLKHNALKCIQILNKIGKARFNYVSYENTEFGLQNWVDEKGITSVFESLPSMILTGEIFVEFEH